MKPEQFIEIADVITERKFSNKRQNGFLLEERNDSLLSGYFIRELPTEIKVYNSDENRIANKITYNTGLVYFEIYPEENFLEISSTKSDVAAFLIELSRLSKFMISISEFIIPFDFVVNFLRRNGFSFYIQKVKVRDSPIWDGIIAECSFTLASYSEEKTFL